MEQPKYRESGPAFSRLEQLVATLRSADGCPWDIKQTPDSLKKYLLEECHELAEALERGHDQEVREEIGDVLFILAMLIGIYSERRSFTGTEVLDGIIAKMIRRHPHVFGSTPMGDDQALQEQWQRIKEEEKQLLGSSRP